MLQLKKLIRAKEKIVWHEVLAGEKAYDKTGNWLPDETLQIIRECLVAIKGPLTTPVGGGIRSLNVALRQMLDLYVCLRPVRYYRGCSFTCKRSFYHQHGDLSGKMPKISMPVLNGWMALLK